MSTPGIAPTDKDSLAARGAEACRLSDRAESSLAWHMTNPLVRGKRSDAGDPGPALEGAGVHPFDVDTAIEQVGPNAYAATITDRWSSSRGPSGGYCMAICLRAVEAVMPFPDPIATAVFFHAAAKPGPVEILTETIRRGSRLATSDGRLMQDGREVLRLVASFADLSRETGRSEEFGSAPGLRGALHDLDPGGAFPGASIADRFEYRVAEMPGWRVGRPGGDPTLEFGIALRPPRANDPLALAMMADVCPRAVYELDEKMLLTLELTAHMRARAVPGPLRGRVSTRHIRADFHEEDLELWDSAGKLVLQSRQLALLTPKLAPRANS